MEVALPSGLPVSGVILVDHVKSVDRTAREMEIVGKAPAAVLEEIDARLGPLLSL
jgi:mRNA interferase MazF